MVNLFFNTALNLLTGSASTIKTVMLSRPAVFFTVSTSLFAAFILFFSSIRMSLSSDHLPYPVNPSEHNKIFFFNPKFIFWLIHPDRHFRIDMTYPKIVLMRVYYQRRYDLW